MLKNRYWAGQKLAEKLYAYRHTDAMVLALPRGGVVVGHAIAWTLSLLLDIITVCKVGHPSNTEYTIGAVDENGVAVFNEEEVGSINERWLQKEVAKQMTEARRRRKLYRKNRKPFNVFGKVVILTDDGIATGITMQLAVKVVKQGNPKKVVVAVPVAPPACFRKLEGLGADEIVFLEPLDEFFGVVGAHYQEFVQVEDEVRKLLGR